MAIAPCQRRERSFLDPCGSRPESSGLDLLFCGAAILRCHGTRAASSALFGRDRIVGRLRARIRGRYRWRQSAGRRLRGVSRRRRRFADSADAIARRPAQRFHPMAAGVFSRRQPKERSHGADRRGSEQRGYPESRRLLRFASAAKAGGRHRLDTLAEPARNLRRSTAAGPVTADDYYGVGPAARLSGQREDVLLKALRDFKSGTRVGSGVASMADVTFELERRRHAGARALHGHAPLTRGRVCGARPRSVRCGRLVCRLSASAAADRAENVGSSAGVSASTADTDDAENVGSFAAVSVSLTDSETAAGGLPVTAKSRKAPPSWYSVTAGTGNSGAAELTEVACGSAH